MAISLESIKRGPQERPVRAFLYGPPGVGKSTWAAGAPSPIVVQTEDGIDQIGVDRFQLCKTFGEALECLRVLGREGHDYRTVVIDSADWLEKMAEAQVAEAHGAKTVEDTSIKAFAYGKGRELASSLMREFIVCLDWLRDNKDMAVVIVGHSEIKKFNDPLGDGYDRYQPRLFKSTLATVVEWSDALLFAGYESFTRTVDDGRKERAVGVGDGRRVLYTDERPGHLAKNRYSLPAQLPLDYAAFAAAMNEHTTKAAQRQNAGASQEEND